MTISISGILAYIGSQNGIFGVSKEYICLPREVLCPIAGIIFCVSIPLLELFDPQRDLFDPIKGL